MSIFRPADATTEPEAPVVAREPSNDPAALRAEAERARSDAARQAADLMASAEQTARELTERAERAEADAQARARAHAYFAAVDKGFAALANEVDREAMIATGVERATAHRDDMLARQRDAERLIDDAQRAHTRLVNTQADWAVQGEGRRKVVEAESVRPTAANEVANAEQGLRQLSDEHTTAVESVRRAWRHLEILEALDGLARPSCVPGPQDKLAAKQRELERDQQLCALAARDPEFQARMAAKRARRDAMRRVLPPELARITNASNAAATFLANQHRA